MQTDFYKENKQNIQSIIFLTKIFLTLGITYLLILITFSMVAMTRM